MHDRLARLLGLAVIATACRTGPSSEAPATEPPPPASAAEDRGDPPPATETPNMDPIARPWTLDVADGNANRYVCRRDDAGAMTFEYVPVTREQSSTGTYDGGAPRTATLTDEQAASVWRAVADAVAATESHTTERRKGTVAISATGPTTAEVIVEANVGAPLVAVLAAIGR